MNLLFFSDLHLKKNELIECQDVLNEILSLCNEHNIDLVFSLGDNFDEILPPSECLDVFSNFISKLNRPIVILIAQSHESSNTTTSVLNHFHTLAPHQIRVMKEYTDKNNLYLGHFIVNESKKNYGGTIPKKDLTKYRKVILGHGHSMEEIGNITQLGACRYIDFAESQDKGKMVMICTNYDEMEENWSYLKLKSPYPMIDAVISEKGAETSSGLKFEDKKWVDRILSLPDKTKLRIIFKDFESYSNSINELDKFKQRFSLFTVKKDFLVQDLALGSVKTEKNNLKDSLKDYLEKNKVNEEIKHILQEEIK